MHLFAATALALGLTAASPAVAQSAEDAPALTFGAIAPQAPALDSGVAEGEAPVPTLSSQSEKDRRLVFTALIGAESRPGYFGSEENIIVPRFSPNLLSLNFGQVDVGDQALTNAEDPNRRPLGFGVGGSFRFVTERSSSDFDELEGLDDIDLAVELGAQIGYVWPNVEAFAALRYGAIGHESWVGEVGAYYVARPTDGLSVRVGPRLLFGSDSYTDTYFGVSSDEASNSEFEAFDPDGGLVSAGIEVIATYKLGEQWWLEGRARWDQLQDDAADSPIVDQGSAELGSLTIGVRRSFVLDF